MASALSDVSFSRAETGIIPCPVCNQPMRLSCISPGLEGYDLQTYDCEKCDRSKSFVVKI